MVFSPDEHKSQQPRPERAKGDKKTQDLDAALQAELDRFHKDTTYREAHLKELLERFPEQWVAIFNEQVVGAALDLEQLLDDLQARGIPPGQAFVERVTAKDETWIFWL